MKYIKTFEQFVNEGNLNEAAQPTTLYHATYKNLVGAIKKEGLDDDESDDGVVFFGVNPKIAKDAAKKTNGKATDVLLKVEVSDLDASKLKEGGERFTYEYDGDIPWDLMSEM
jgi:uncharacterized protein (DUF952 family)